MFRLPNTLPDNRNNLEEITDFIEWECIKNGHISLIETLKPLLIISDEENFDGVEDDTDYINDELVVNILIEIRKRKTACRDRYPFVLYNKDYNLVCNKVQKSFFIYAYLLLSTRLNMKDDRVWANIDGTHLLEKLSALIGKNYFGYNADCMVFGTSEKTGFKNSIEELIEKIGEGYEFTNKDTIPTRAKDANLDVVVWKTFSDLNHSKIIGFGQCKTGSSWGDEALLELQPDAFCDTWLHTSPIVTPIKMFFCSKSFPFIKYSLTIKGGLIFDRFRIIDYLPDSLDHSLMLEIISWLREVISTYSIKGAKPKNNLIKKK